MAEAENGGDGDERSKSFHTPLPVVRVKREPIPYIWKA
jgi:hypothetical protein